MNRTGVVLFFALLAFTAGIYAGARNGDIQRLVNGYADTPPPPGGTIIPAVQADEPERPRKKIGPPGGSPPTKDRFRQLEEPIANAIVTGVFTEDRDFPFLATAENKNLLLCEAKDPRPERGLLSKAIKDRQDYDPGEPIEIWHCRVPVVWRVPKLQTDGEEIAYRLKEIQRWRPPEMESATPGDLSSKPVDSSKPRKINPPPGSRVTADMFTSLEEPLEETMRINAFTENRDWPFLVSDGQSHFALCEAKDPRPNPERDELAVKERSDYDPGAAFEIWHCRNPVIWNVPRSRQDGDEIAYRLKEINRLSN